MKKTNQFDDIKAGDLIRFLKNPMRGNSPRNNWSFGIVAYRLKTAFCVYPVGRPSYSKGITIRYDGMNGPGKDAVHIEAMYDGSIVKDICTGSIGNNWKEIKRKILNRKRREK